MRPPCEILVSQILPAIRAIISHHLITEYGFTQNQVAELLGVTQASVSRSLANYRQFSKHYGPSVTLAAVELAKQLAIGELSPEGSITALCNFCRNQKIGGVICRLHRRSTPELKSCKACIEEVQPKARIMVLNNLQRAALLLEKSEEFTLLIPQVQAQLVMSSPNPQNIEDIAGFPSRIGIQNNRPYSYSMPEFGASEHLSKILLLVMQTRPNWKAAIVFKYIKVLENILQNTGINFNEVIRKTVKNERNSDEALLLGFNEVLKSQDPAPIFIDKGILGIEPVVYLFAEDAIVATREAIQIAQLVAQSK